MRVTLGVLAVPDDDYCFDFSGDARNMYSFQFKGNKVVGVKAAGYVYRKDKHGNVIADEWLDFAEPSQWEAGADTLHTNAYSFMFIWKQSTLFVRRMVRTEADEIPAPITGVLFDCQNPETEGQKEVNNIWKDSEVSKPEVYSPLSPPVAGPKSGKKKVQFGGTLGPTTGVSQRSRGILKRPAPTGTPLSNNVAGPTPSGTPLSNNVAGPTPSGAASSISDPVVTTSGAATPSIKPKGILKHRSTNPAVPPASPQSNAPDKKKRNVGLIVSMSILGCLVIGAAVYFFVFRHARPASL